MMIDDSYPHSIELDANNDLGGDFSVWPGPGRIARLNRVVGFLCARGIHEKVYSLYDHKGSLTVTWLKNPSLTDKAIVEEAWGSDIAMEWGEIDHQVVPPWFYWSSNIMEFVPGKLPSDLFEVTP